MANDDETARRKRAAFISINHHAFQDKPRPEGLPEKYGPMPIIDAARTAVELGSPREREIAIAHLIGAGNHVQIRPEGETIEPQNMDREHARDQLIDEWRTAITLLAEGILPPNLDSLFSIDPFEMGRQEAEQAVYRLFESREIGGGAPGVCFAGKPAVWVTQPADTLVSSVRVDLDIHEDPINPLRVDRLLHPVLWSAHYPDYFMESYRTMGTDFNADGSPVELPGTVGSDTAPWGYEGTHQFIYEKLKFPTNEAPPLDVMCEYHNLLKVEFTGLTGGANFFVEMNYKLYDSLFADVLFGMGFHGSNGINVDSGFMRATRYPGQNRWKWIGIKSIRFRDFTEGQPLPDVPDFGHMMNWMLPPVLLDFVQSGMLAGACMP